MVPLLLRPARTLRELASADVAGSLWRRPLALTLAWGVMTSTFVSGRLSARLVADGAISFAFVPVVQVLALAIAVRMRRPRRDVPFARLVDVFCAGNAPWLLWMAVMAAIFAVVPPRVMSYWFSPLTWTAIIPAVWSFWIDVHFFEQMTGRSRRGATIDALTQHAVGWTMGILYFFGIGIYSLVVSWLATRAAS